MIFHQMNGTFGFELHLQVSRKVFHTCSFCFRIVSRHEIIFCSQVKWLILDSCKTCSRQVCLPTKMAAFKLQCNLHSGKASRKKMLWNKNLRLAGLNVKHQSFHKAKCKRKCTLLLFTLILDGHGLNIWFCLSFKTDVQSRKYRLSLLAQQLEYGNKNFRQMIMWDFSLIRWRELNSLKRPLDGSAQWTML